jgi:enoyl-CoA hydratase/carnithine racemase
MLSSESRDGVCTITLERPEKRNALSLELRMTLAEVLNEAGADADVTATVVTGAGSAFCAGFDMSQFGGDEANRRAIAETTEAFFSALVEHPKPLIAAVNGPAMGAGFALALLSDIRLASETATFGFPQVLRGIPPSYAAARAVLPPALATELCITGRLLDADEAKAVGLVSEIVTAASLVDRAQTLARELAPPAIASQVKAHARAEAEQTWLPLLEREKLALREAVLSPR